LLKAHAHLTIATALGFSAACWCCCPCLVCCAQQLRSAAQYDPELPRIRALLEKAREAHWQLTADKGFAALKVCCGCAQQQQQQWTLPEQQQHTPHGHSCSARGCLGQSPVLLLLLTASSDRVARLTGITQRP